MDEDELFNPDYVEVDRVIDMKTSTDATTGEETALYLVKWRSLPYDECTWELAQDIDTEKIQAFLRVKDPPPENERKVRNFLFLCTYHTILQSFMSTVLVMCTNVLTLDFFYVKARLNCPDGVLSLCVLLSNDGPVKISKSVSWMWLKLAAECRL